jgi:hypothetical protein
MTKRSTSTVLFFSNIWRYICFCIVVHESPDHYKGHDTSEWAKCHFRTTTSNQTSRDQGLHNGECWRVSRFWRTAVCACVASLLSRSQACFKLRAEKRKTGGHRGNAVSRCFSASGWQSCSYTLATVIWESCFLIAKDICDQSACVSRVTPFYKIVAVWAANYRGREVNIYKNLLLSVPCVNVSGIIYTENKLCGLTYRILPI